MSARKIQVSVECLDADTGVMEVSVEDPANPVDEFTFQSLVLHPQVCHLLHHLLGVYVSQGIGITKSLSLNAPDTDGAS